MKFDINGCVRVQLTDKGREIIDKRDAFYGIRCWRPEEDTDGWSRWQLWILMWVFGGEHMQIIAELPFCSKIEIEEES